MVIRRPFAEVSGNAGAQRYVQLLVFSTSWVCIFPHPEDLLVLVDDQ